MEWLPQIETASKAVDNAAAVLKSRKGRLSNLYKAAKADGCDTEAIRSARHHDRLDHLTVAATYANTGRVLRLMGSPLASQFSLFDQPAWPEPVNASLAGFAAGKRGDSADTSPHTPGSELDGAWRDGWSKGQGEVHETLKE